MNNVSGLKFPGTTGFKTLDGDMPSTNEPYGLSNIPAVNLPTDKVEISKAALQQEKVSDPDMPSTNEPYGQKS